MGSPWKADRFCIQRSLIVFAQRLLLHLSTRHWAISIAGINVSSGGWRHAADHYRGNNSLTFQTMPALSSTKRFPVEDARGGCYQPRRATSESGGLFLKRCISHNFALRCRVVPWCLAHHHLTGRKLATGSYDGMGGISTVTKSWIWWMPTTTMSTARVDPTRAQIRKIPPLCRRSANGYWTTTGITPKQLSGEFSHHSMAARKS